MYSVVLMMALSSGGEVAPQGFLSHGCNGGGYGSFHGGGGGCYGGGGGHKLFGGHGCNGGHGFFHGGGGGCDGGGGGHRLFGGHGCNGGHGFFHGGGGGCCGNGYAAHHGCYGGYGAGAAPVYNGCTGGTVAPPPPGARPMPPPPGTKPETVPGGKPVAPKKPEASLSAPATIFVRLPAEAKLTVDGAATQSTSSTRIFASPTLEPGSDYFYTLKAEIVRDGQTITASKRIAVRAGEETRVSINFPEASVAQR